MITLSKVATGYGKRHILENISFTAEKGQVTVILGKNGCGKSTLLKAISGNLSYSGSILVDNCEISGVKASSRAKIISAMPQMMHAPSVTVREFVSYGRQPYTGKLGILSHEDREIVESALEQADIKALAERKVNRISGGERQRAYFAMLLAQKTDNILLDEPGAHLDARYNKQLADFLRLMSKSEKTVVTVLHDINRALEIADKIVFIDEGTVLFCGSASDFINSNIPQSVLGLNKLTCTENNVERCIFI